MHSSLCFELNAGRAKHIETLKCIPKDCLHVNYVLLQCLNIILQELFILSGWYCSGILFRNIDQLLPYTCINANAILVCIP